MNRALSLPLLMSVLVASLTVTGCASKKALTTPTTAPTASTSSTSNPAGGASTTGLGDQSALGSQPLDANGNPINSAQGPQDALRAALQNRVVHFDFDSSEVSDSDVGTLSAHAGYLKQNSSARVTLAGHTDERGTREYNMALGERRAKAVQAFLLTNGVNSQQIDTVSYGKETPVNEGHDEAAWAENRRVELKYDAGAP